MNERTVNKRPRQTLHSAHSPRMFQQSETYNSIACTLNSSYTKKLDFVSHSSPHVRRGTDARNEHLCPGALMELWLYTALFIIEKDTPLHFITDNYKR